jgi:hypothetical protein
VEINSAADLAAILDPEHQVPGWWDPAGAYCCLCNRRPDDRDNNSPLSRCCLAEWKLMPAHHTGPADLHTAREHAWRMENWLDARGCSILRLNGWTFVRAKGEYLNSISDDDNHTAALVAAIERVSE